MGKTRAAWEPGQRTLSFLSLGAGPVTIFGNPAGGGEIEIVYEIVATNYGVAGVGIQVWNGPTQVGSFIVAAGTTASFPVAGAMSGVLMSDLWLVLSPAATNVDVSVITH